MGLVSIITPCSRPNNLDKLYASMNWELITKWYIIYDTSKDRSYINKYTDNEKIAELECNEEGVCGHPQINFGLKQITDGYVYFLDDDNIIHPEFWNTLPALDPDFIYTWNQIRRINPPRSFVGNIIKSRFIDTAQFIVPRKYIGDIIWMPDKRVADGKFITDIKAVWPNKFKYINKDISYFNYLRQ